MLPVTSHIIRNPTVHASASVSQKLNRFSITWIQAENTMDHSPQTKLLIGSPGNTSPSEA